VELPRMRAVPSAACNDIVPGALTGIMAQVKPH
jgi:hypothetical protein